MYLENKTRRDLALLDEVVTIEEGHSNDGESDEPGKALTHSGHDTLCDTCGLGSHQALLISVSVRK